jgi:hypothetical protein
VPSESNAGHPRNAGHGLFYRKAHEFAAQRARELACDKYKKIAEDYK